MPVNGPAQMLRRLRVRAGLSQSQLAALADVHERTVRGMELGHVARPRQTTVRLLSRALALDLAEAREFADAWGWPAGGLGEPWRHTVTRLASTEIGRRLARSAQDTTLVSATEIVEIGADRREQRRRIHEVVTALRDGVRHRLISYDPEDRAVDADLARMEDVENARVEREWTDLAHRVRLFDLAFDRTLASGQYHSIHYTISSGADGSEVRHDAPGVDRALGGFVRSPALYVLEVRFHDDVTPVDVTQVFQPTPQAPLDVVRPLEVVAGRVHLVLVDPRPGGHGLEWRW